MVWVGLYEAGLSDEWNVRVMGFPSLDAFKQRLRRYRGAVCETSGTLRIIPTLVASLPDGDHEAPRWQ